MQRKQEEARIIGWQYQEKKNRRKADEKRRRVQTQKKQRELVIAHLEDRTKKLNVLKLKQKEQRQKQFKERQFQITILKKKQAKLEE